jgi:hypothetical protein
MPICQQKYCSAAFAGDRILVRLLKAFGELVFRVRQLVFNAPFVSSTASMVD